MTNPQKKKKKTEIIEVWGRLKERIFRQKEDYQLQLNQIFVSLLSSSKITIPPNKHFSFGEVMIWVQKVRKEVENLKRDLQKEKGWWDKWIDDNSVPFFEYLSNYNTVNIIYNSERANDNVFLLFNKKIASVDFKRRFKELTYRYYLNQN